MISFVISRVFVQDPRFHIFSFGNIFIIYRFFLSSLNLYDAFRSPSLILHYSFNIHVSTRLRSRNIANIFVQYPRSSRPFVHVVLSLFITHFHNHSPSAVPFGRSCRVEKKWKILIIQERHQNRTFPPKKKTVRGVKSKQRENERKWWYIKLNKQGKQKTPNRRKQDDMQTNSKRTEESYMRNQ